MEENILREIGLSESEIKVYTSLLRNGDSTRGEIVKSSGIAGSKVYEVLDRLQKKGLTSVYLKNKIKHFKPTNPKQIFNYLDQKKEKFEKLEKKLELSMPSFLDLFSSSKEDQEVELLSGIKGLEIIFREQVELLNKGDTCYVIGGTKGIDEKTIQDFFEKIHLLREEKKIKTKMLFNLNQKDSTKMLYSSKKYPSTTTKYIGHTSPVAINIYGDRTVIIIFGREISAISIKSKDVSKSFLEYFNLLWKSAVR